ALRILGAGLAFTFLGATCQYALLALRAHRSVLAINVLALSINVVLTSILAASHGAVGAAIALASAEATVSLFAMALLARSRLRARYSVAFAARVAVCVLLGAGAA